MVLNSKQRQIGKDNFNDAVQVTRRQFLATAGLVPTAAAMYFGYKHLEGNPVKAGIIGTGDQGNYAHLSQSNPEFIRFIAFSDIRPSSVKRTWKTLQDMYGKEANQVKFYEKYQELLDNPDIELVVIALPLHLHAPVTIEALKKGKHVLCEKLMAKTVDECKKMVQAADDNKRLLAIGHQRHYSYLYANALSIIQQGILGDIKHIRALWHRNQTGGGAPDGTTGKYDSWSLARQVAEEDKSIAPEILKESGYENLEHLLRWRINEKTGGGLMVELGSHQLDAASIFLDKEHPKSVQGVGVNAYFKDGRQVYDHVYLIYEFPKDVVLTYSSIGTNTLDGYGETVLGPKGTLIIDQERDAYLFKEPGLKDDRLTGEAIEKMVTNAEKDTRMTWAENRMSRPAAESTSTAAWGSGIGAADTLTSRGYREQQEHLCWIIRNGGVDCEQKPRCNGRVAMGDAVVTLASNIAMKLGKRVEFKKEWFDVASNATPEADLLK
ncbi:MAG TPA: Gfo/Idh/MocA family oxidoreductase [Phycisphaerae bacterium]|nr:Gfo/Idh/MocA family oxidoreductase [Phycisphaerae bacterium]HRY68634.1 Gfo/Idh/MocA family oxidoreductase [Phycisphaerae bacterium]HSA25460.1 Gfo/Idh/MocA family oxidoreductase [Phycisphaerae bacterium]